MAMLGCINARANPTTSCTSFSAIGANNPLNEPPGAFYRALSWSGNLYVDVCISSRGNYNYNGCLETECRMGYIINPNTGIATKRTRGCSIDF